MSLTACSARVGIRVCFCVRVRVSAVSVCSLAMLFASARDTRVESADDELRQYSRARLCRSLRRKWAGQRRSGKRSERNE